VSSFCVLLSSLSLKISIVKPYKKIQMAFFLQSVTLAQLNATSQGNMIGELGIEYIEVGEDYLAAKMPVNHKTKQPLGLLHGGASVALAETVGTMASYLLVDSNYYDVVGLEINANHIRKASDGYVYATAKPLHIGKSTHVWDIQLTNEQGMLICVSRLTVAVMPKKNFKAKVV
jgi:1,4-dihydroxy-2-naphthoyl-CoA hydrolase